MTRKAAKLTEPGPLVIISGPPGAGKSTVAHELVKLTTGPSALIEGDQFWGFFAKTDESGDYPLRFRTIMRAMVSSGISYCLSGYETIVDFSIPLWYLGGVRKMTVPRNISVDYVVLYPSMDICRSRAAEREVGKIEDYTQFAEFYGTFANAGAHAVVNPELDPATLAAKLYKGILNGDFRLSATEDSANGGINS